MIKDIKKLPDKFTVIVPVYNSHNTIKKVLDNLEPLSDSGIEIIISDNCSNDGTKDILNQYKSKGNYTIIYQDKNTGTKNTGYENLRFLLQQVSTKWVLPIGSDDYLINAGLLKSEFQKYTRYKNIVGMSFNSQFLYSYGLVADKCNRSLIGSDLIRFIKFYLFPGCNSRFYGIIRKDLLLGNFPLEPYYANDIVLSAKILENGNWYYNKKIILHREKGTSSDQLALRSSYGYKGMKALLPPFKFVKDLMNLNSSRNLIVKMAILLLYFRYAVSPIKHYLNRK